MRLKRIEAYVLSAERLHGDDTTVPVLAKGKTDTGRIWVYVRDDKPFGGRRPLPASSAIGWFVGDEPHEGSLHMQITAIGLEIAKEVFQVHGIDAAEKQ